MIELADKQAVDLYEEALLQTQGHDISSALENLLQALEMDSENVEIINLIADCYYVLGDFSMAEACWERVLEIEASNAIAAVRLDDYRSPSFQFWLKRYHAAIKQVESKNYEAAQSMLRELLEEHEGFVGVYQILGLCYLACSDKSNARKAWEKGLELDSSNTSLLSYLSTEEKSKTKGNMEMAGQRENKQRSNFNKNNLLWLLSGVLCLALLIQSGIYLKNSRSSQETIAEMKVQIEDLADEVQQEANIAAIPVPSENENLPTTKASNEDSEITMAGSDYDTDREKHYYDEGYNAYLNGDWKKAKSNLGMVVAMQSQTYLNREALYYLARVYYLNMDYENAEKYYLKYAHEFPDSNYYDDSLFYLGCVYYYTGRSEEAREILENLRELDPQSGYLLTDVFLEVMGS